MPAAAAAVNHAYPRSGLAVTGFGRFLGPETPGSRAARTRGRRRVSDPRASGRSRGDAQVVSRGAQTGAGSRPGPGVAGRASAARGPPSGNAQAARRAGGDPRLAGGGPTGDRGPIAGRSGAAIGRPVGRCQGAARPVPGAAAEGRPLARRSAAGWPAAAYLATGGGPRQATSCPQTTAHRARAHQPAAVALISGWARWYNVVPSRQTRANHHGPSRPPDFRLQGRPEAARGAGIADDNGTPGAAVTRPPHGRRRHLVLTRDSHRAAPPRPPPHRLTSPTPNTTTPAASTAAPT